MEFPRRRAWAPNSRDKNPTIDSAVDAIMAGCQFHRR
jgi:hypothetical protein